MSVLCLESVSKSYEGTLALARLSLDFPEGCITAVIGPSGCGKSTLLKLCNGLVQPDTGEIRVFGTALDYGRLPPLRRKIGYAVQGTGLFPHLTVLENITLLAVLEGWQHRDIELRVDELLALTQLEPLHLSRYPHQLSGGQQQRVGLCRAMMLRPAILLLDEPFAAIDPITRIDIHEQLLILHEAEPTTAVLVTHDMREALRLAQHLVIMDEGCVVHSMSKAEIAAMPEASDPDQLLRQLMNRQAS